MLMAKDSDETLQNWGREREEGRRRENATALQLKTIERMEWKSGVASGVCVWRKRK